MSSNKIVGYFYDEELPNFNYGGGNPMRPHRVRLTNSLIKGYNLLPKMLIHRPVARSFEQITEFHADDYVDFLRSVSPDNQDEYMTQLRRFNMGLPGEADCPVFDGMFKYCSMYSGGSVGGAALLAQGSTDICLNWSGGMHHAKKAEASGFCYINDIVLAILELLKVYARVLYVDIDIHHGDGVEEAFYLTDRVMTVSFHKYGDFFPGTGALRDIGYGEGTGYALNVPLREGMDDESYRSVFEPVLEKVMQRYDPGAIVVCGGADSLSGDRLGCFNLSLEGHSNCVEFLARWNKPILVLGGGGYTMRNVARCWCYESGRLMGVDLPDQIPTSSLAEFQYYADTCRLRIAVSNMKNANAKDELEKITIEVLQNLSELPPVPSAHMAYRPGLMKLEDETEEDPEARGGGEHFEDKRIVKDGDESDEEEDDRGARRDMSYRDIKVEHAVAHPAAKPMDDDHSDEECEKNPKPPPRLIIKRPLPAPSSLGPEPKKTATAIPELPSAAVKSSSGGLESLGQDRADRADAGGDHGKAGVAWREPPVSLSMPKAEVMDWSSTPATTNGSVGGSSRGPSPSTAPPVHTTPAHSGDGPESHGVPQEREAHSSPSHLPAPSSNHSPPKPPAARPPPPAEKSTLTPHLSPLSKTDYAHHPKPTPPPVPSMPIPAEPHGDNPSSQPGPRWGNNAPVPKEVRPPAPHPPSGEHPHEAAPERGAPWPTSEAPHAKQGHSALGDGISGDDKAAEDRSERHGAPPRAAHNGNA